MRVATEKFMHLDSNIFVSLQTLEIAFRHFVLSPRLFRGLLTNILCNFQKFDKIKTHFTCAGRAGLKADCWGSD